MSADEIKLVIMSVGATITVMSFFFAIRNRIVDNKKGLSISHTTQAMLVGYDAKYSGIVIRIYLLNSGNVNLFVNRPYIKLPYKLNGFDQWDIINTKDTAKYPVKLEPGQEHSIEMSLENFLKNFGNIKWYRRVHFEARDSKGSIYKSKKIWFKSFINQGELHKTLEQQNA